MRTSAIVNVHSKVRRSPRSSLIVLLPNDLIGVPFAANRRVAPGLVVSFSLADGGRIEISAPVSTRYDCRVDASVTNSRRLLLLLPSSPISVGVRFVSFLDGNCTAPYTCVPRLQISSATNTYHTAVMNHGRRWFLRFGLVCCCVVAVIGSANGNVIAGCS